jgi:hypothetical protein
LAEFIRANVRRVEQPEVRIMRQTIAEALMEEGGIKSKRETLLRQLRLRFKRVSPVIAAEIQAAQDSRQLDAWLDAFATADKLSHIPFQASKEKVRAAKKTRVAQAHGDQASGHGIATECEALAELIWANVRQTAQPEVRMMGQAMAEALVEEGGLTSKRETLLRQSRLRFKRISPAIAAEILAAQDGRQLDDWLDAFATADNLSSIPFQASKKK